MNVKLDFRDQMMTVIAVVLDAGDISPDEYGEKMTPEKITKMNQEIMQVFLSIHKKGMDDMRRAFVQRSVAK